MKNQYPRRGLCIRCGRENQPLLKSLDLCPDCHERDLAELRILNGVLTGAIEGSQ